MVFRVDFYDAFDGWCQTGFPIGFDKSREFESKDEAIEKCKELQLENPPNSMGEHYGVIDLSKGFEVFCGKTWFEWKVKE